MDPNISISADAPSPAESDDALYRKVTFRLIPFLFICYILSYVDRVNVGFAKLQMQQDLGMSDAIFGAGMGIFFFGYFLFEVPCNLMLQRVGARLWIGPIMIVWGLVSSSFVFVRTPTVFYVMRFLLGVAESGFFPGVVLYLTYWYPGKYRARMVAAFMSAIALSGAFGGPVAGWIMSRAPHPGGMSGWQWLFALEGLPSALLGVMAMFYLDDNPRTAKWLMPVEREILTQRIEEDEIVKAKDSRACNSMADAFKSRHVWLLSLVYFGVIMGNYYVSFWMPQLIKDRFTQDPWQIGLISMVPWGFGAVTMICWGRHSDVSGERRWHMIIALVAAAFFLVLSGLRGLAALPAIVILSLMTGAIMAGLSTFWALPTRILSGSAAAGGIAWINSVGNLGGFLSPYVVGAIRDRTSEPIYPAGVIAAACLVAAVIVWLLPRSSAPPTGRSVSS